MTIINLQLKIWPMNLTGQRYIYPFTNSVLAVIATSSLTTGVGVPPPTPKSDLLMEPETLKPAIVFLLYGCTAVPLKVTSSVTVLVTPCKVKSPTILYFFPSTLVSDLLLNVNALNLSASKKSGLFRCLSRPSLLVLTVATSADNSTMASLKSSLVEVILASNQL